MNKFHQQLVAQTFTRTSQLRVLVNVRWFYIAVQITALFAAPHLFNLQVSPLAFLPFLLILIIFNLATLNSIRRTQFSSEKIIWLQLLLDLLCISLLLFFSGGATNALVSIMLLPVTLSALLCSSTKAWITALIAIGLYSFLMFGYNEPSMENHSHMSPGWSHYVGMWITFTLSALVLVYFINRLVNNLTQQHNQLAALTDQQLRDEHLITLANQSANAAHRLSTPLNTIELLVDELNDSAINPMVLDEIKQQLNRCKESLQSIRQSVDEHLHDQTISLTDFFEQLQQQWRLLHPEHQLLLTVQKLPVSTIEHASQLLSALLNLLDNAARENQLQKIEQTEMQVELDGEQLQILIINGNSRQLSEHELPLGDYWTGQKSGLGIGYYLAHATLERVGGAARLLVTNDQIKTQVTIPIQSGVQ
ncbi:ATP-binding protein [Pleionea litopenaei]|uniref:Histidine kinase domain-containing protein n=1 Tax=Pleionea litopenaei TaxID=3070815 RepID=A0AA51RWX3_9GAMM|nr:ATP-binding protein [Pleionea sp. HL-JVS1]WMS88964.1 hypothetical protein Q9312_08620 [Pleionea sp. HL-JVS1]